jgi:hypothetical protein
MARLYRIMPWIACLLAASCGVGGQNVTTPNPALSVVVASQPAVTRSVVSDFSPVPTPSAGVIPFENLLDTATPDRPPAETVPPEPQSVPCTVGLAYMGDLTYPDKVKVLPGQPVEKQWKVRNDGSCDWGPDYRFRWINGTLPAAQVEQALYPAVGGSEAMITVRLTAPATAGEYISWWQAVSPSGIPFGEMLSVDIIVAP